MAEVPPPQQKARPDPTRRARRASHTRYSGNARRLWEMAEEVLAHPRLQADPAAATTTTGADRTGGSGGGGGSAHSTSVQNRVIEVQL